MSQVATLLWGIVIDGKRLDAKGLGLKFLDQAIDTTGRLMFNMLGAQIAQFERELMIEPQRKG